MTAGFSSRPIAGPIVSLSRGALAGVLAATLLAGGLLGATVAFEVGSTSSSRSVSAISATDASAVSQALIQVRAGERASFATPVAGHVPSRIGLAPAGQLNEKRR